MKEKKASSKMSLGYGWFIAAVIFLVNPCLNVIDILPDFFGYMFLLRAVTKWSDLCLAMRGAVANISRLRWFMLIKMLSVVLIPTTDKGMPLLLTFSFAVIELIYILPAIGKFFDGMDYFATRFDGKSPTMNINSVKSATYIFFIGKAALTLLPELCSLSSFEYSGFVTTAPQIDFADFKNLFIIVNIVFTTLLGILWLVSILPYIQRIAKDTPFLTRILNAYNEEIAGDRNLAVRRNTKSTVTVVIAALAFIPNIALDNFNIIPNFAVGIFILLTWFYMKRLAKVSRWIPISAILSATVGIASFVLNIVFEITHGIGIVIHRPDAAKAIAFYNYTRVLSGLDYVLMGICICLAFIALKRIILMLLEPTPTDDPRIAAMNSTSTKSMQRKLNGGLAVLLISVALNLVYTMIRASIHVAFWLIPFLATVVSVIWVSVMLRDICDQIDYKYM